MKVLSCAVVFVSVATSVLSMPKLDGVKDKENPEDAISFEDLEDFLNVQNVGVKNDVSNKLLGTGKKLLNVIMTASKKSKKAEQELKDDTKRLLDELVKGIDKTNNLYREYAEPALQSMLNTNVQLKDQRNKLNEVVFRVKFTLKDLKAIANAIFKGEITDDETINQVVNHQVALMRDLITETEKIIDAAHDVYNSIKETFAQVQLNMHVYKTEIQKILDSAKEDTIKHKTAVEASRAAIYTSCGGSTAYCIIFDIFLTFGACSAINAGVCGGMIATMEVAIAAEDPYYEELLARSNRAHTIAKGIYEEQKSLEEYLTKETSSLGRLDATLRTTNNNLKLSETIFKKNIPHLRKNYIAVLDNLENACQKYLDQEEL